jgi:hypothetical protein
MADKEKVKQTFACLEDGVKYVMERAEKGNVIPSEIWNMRNAHNLHATHKQANSALKCLGVTILTARFCARVAPGGKWIIVEEKVDRKHVRFMAYYSRFLPYALAMCKCEDEFNYDGINESTINFLYRSFMGYVDLGLGLFKEQNDHDATLFSQVYEACNRLFRPTLPFDEAINPCAVFAFIQNRQWFTQNVVTSDEDRRLIYAVKAVAALKVDGISDCLLKPFDRASM